MREYYIERTRILMADREMLDSVTKVINLGGIEGFLQLATIDETESFAQRRERFNKKVNSILVLEIASRCDPTIKKLHKRFKYFDSIVATDLFSYVEEEELKERLHLRKQALICNETQPEASHAIEKQEQECSQDSDTYSKTPTPTSDSEKNGPPAPSPTATKHHAFDSGI